MFLFLFFSPCCLSLVPSFVPFRFVICPLFVFFLLFPCVYFFSACIFQCVYFFSAYNFSVRIIFHAIFFVCEKLYVLGKQQPNEMLLRGCKKKMKYFSLIPFGKLSCDYHLFKDGAGNIFPYTLQQATQHGSFNAKWVRELSKDEFFHLGGVEREQTPEERFNAEWENRFMEQTMKEMLHCGNEREQEQAKRYFDTEQADHLIDQTMKEMMHSENDEGVSVSVEKQGGRKGVEGEEWYVEKMKHENLMRNVELVIKKKVCPHCKKEVSLMSKCTVMQGQYHTNLVF